MIWLTSWLLAKNLWSKVLLKRREILIRLVKRKIAKAKPEQNPIKAEILNPYTDVDNVDTNNISSILELDQSDENLLIKNSKAEDTHTNSDIIVTLHSEILGA